MGKFHKSLLILNFEKYIKYVDFVMWSHITNPSSLPRIYDTGYSRSVVDHDASAIIRVVPCQGTLIWGVVIMLVPAAGFLWYTLLHAIPVDPARKLYTILCCQKAA